MKQMKYRTYDKEEKKMKLVTKIEWDWEENKGEIYLTAMAGEMFDGTPIKYDIENDLSVMRYIGLYDKNGKEIYEGDIVKDKNKLFEIVWSNSLLAWQMRELSKNPDKFIHFLNSDLEVIGNKFEYKNLLKGK